MTSNYKICTKCVCDTSIPGISFDDIGICNFCTIHDEMEKQYPIDESQESKLNSIVKKLKLMGKIGNMIVSLELAAEQIAHIYYILQYSWD